MLYTIADLRYMDFLAPAQHMVRERGRGGAVVQVAARMRQGRWVAH